MYIYPETDNMFLGKTKYVLKNSKKCLEDLKIDICANSKKQKENQKQLQQ